MQNQWGIRLTTAISRKTAALRRNNYFFQRVPQQSSGPLRHFFRPAWLRPTPNTTPARATQLALSRIIKHERQRRLLSYTNNVEVISSSSSNSSNNKVADNVVNSKPPAIPAATPPYTNLLPLDWVLSPLVRSVLPFIGHTAYLMIVSGFLMTDMLQLRVVLAAGYSFLVVFHAHHPRPLRIPLGWSGMFVLVNASAAALLLMDRYAPGELTEADESLYENSFKDALTKGQFYQLLKLAERQTVPSGTILSEEGKPCDKLYFIEHGSAKLYHQGTRTAVIEQGGFINDVAFSRGLSIGAYGTALTDDDTVSLLIWDAPTLKEYLKKRPDMDRNMKYLLCDHLVKSLLRQRDGTRERAASAQQQQWRWWWWTTTTANLPRHDDDDED
jgi:CRP-like cAMP-binding protein